MLETPILGNNPWEGGRLWPFFMVETGSERVGRNPERGLGLGRGQGPGTPANPSRNKSPSFQHPHSSMASQETLKISLEEEKAGGRKQQELVQKLQGEKNTGLTPVGSLQEQVRCEEEGRGGPRDWGPVRGTGPSQWE